MKFKNPLAVNENDTLGTALLKGATEGYIKGTLAGLAGLGVLAVIGKCVTKKKDSKKTEEDEEFTEEEYTELEKTRIRLRAEEVLERHRNQKTK